MPVRALPVLLLSLLAAAAGAQPAARAPLQISRCLADRGDWGSAVAVPQVTDGKPDTNWNSGQMDLRVSAANLLLELPAPAAVGALELDTVVSKGWLRLTELEVYAAVAGGWALLGSVTGNTATAIRLELKPCVTQCVRVRLRDNNHPDHCWGVVAEVRLLGGPAPQAAPAAAPPGGETRGERLFVAAALGQVPSYPRTPFDPARGELGYVRSFADTLLEHGVDRYGPAPSPLFVSLLMLDDKAHPQSVIPSIPGQRIGDRAFFGSNLQHDVPLLCALPELSRLTGEPRYARAAEDYLRYFATHCTETPTGLWPWGEHGHWDVFKDQPGHYLHEYLGAPPLALLDQLWQARPEAVLGEARGLLNHVRNFEDYTFCRHADFLKPLTDPRQADRKGLDFARHGGMFVRWWAYAYGRSQDPVYLQYCEGMLRHFELTRLKGETGRGPAEARPVQEKTDGGGPAGGGFLPVLSQYSDRPALQPSPSSNLSVGVSLLEAAPLLGQTPAGEHAARLGRELLAAYAAAPPRPPSAPVFGMAYGSSEFAGGDAVLNLQAWRLTGDARHLEAAKAFAAVYREVSALPPEGNIRAEVYGLLVNLYLDLAVADAGGSWLPAAERYARLGIEDLYYEGLFRGASNLGYYDSELYVSTFVYGLVRLEGHRRAPAQALPPLCFHR